ncbi:hypothetical protein GOODEAATRI_020884, partial [Goodea atripinnis]
VMCLEAATYNRAATAFAAFKRATDRHGVPSRVRGDQGVENVDIARYMFTVWGTDRGSFISGKSVHNQRIKRLWQDIRMCVTSHYYSTLHSLDAEHLMCPLKEIFFLSPEIPSTTQPRPADISRRLEQPPSPDRRE